MNILIYVHLQKVIQVCMQAHVQSHTQHHACAQAHTITQTTHAPIITYMCTSHAHNQMCAHRITHAHKRMPKYARVKLLRSNSFSFTQLQLLYSYLILILTSQVLE